MIRVFVGGSNSRGSYAVYKGLPIKGWMTIPFIATIDHSTNVIWESYRLWGQHLTYLQMIPQFYVSCYLLLVTGDFLLTMLNQQNPHHLGEYVCDFFQAPFPSKSKLRKVRFSEAFRSSVKRENHVDDICRVNWTTKPEEWDNHSCWGSSEGWNIKWWYKLVGPPDPGINGAYNACKWAKTTCMGLELNL